MGLINSIVGHYATPVPGPWIERLLGFRMVSRVHLKHIMGSFKCSRTRVKNCYALHSMGPYIKPMRAIFKADAGHIQSRCGPLDES